MEKKVFYVYHYIDKATKQPFYVGKGKGDRKWSHLREARKGRQGALYDAIRKLNYEDGVNILEVYRNVTEWEALSHECQEIESIGRLIIGTGPLLNRTSGGEGLSGGIDKYGYRKEGIAENEGRSFRSRYSTAEEFA
jgi:hypothetical protein